MISTALLFLGALAIWIGVGLVRDWEKEGEKAWREERRLMQTLWGGQPSVRYYAWQVRVGGYAAIFVGVAMLTISLLMAGATWF